MTKTILLIIPAYNEEKSIVSTVNAIKEKYDYVVIDDGSTDNTKQILKENNFNYISLVQNLGIGGAMQTGYKYAALNNYDIAIQFDGDGQHDENYIDNLVDPIITGKANFVIGSRYIKGRDADFQSTFGRRLGKNIISICIKILTKIKITDPTSGFRAADKEVIKIFKDYYIIEYPEPETTLILLKNKYKVEEIPVQMKERKAGVSSIRFGKTVYYMISVVLALFLSNKGRYK